MTRCPQCGTDIAPSLLACPACRTLVHAEELKRLASHAETLTAAGRLADALVAWRTALDLLPPDSRQYAAVSASIAELSQRADAAGIIVLALVAAGRAWGGEAPEEGDARTLWEYGLLTVALGALTRIPVPAGALP